MKRKAVYGKPFEYIANEILQNVFPDEFVELENGDKPDLYDKNKKIGVEVTTVSNDGAIECGQWLENTQDYEKIKPKYIKGYYHGKGFTISPVILEENKKIYDAINRKRIQWKEYKDCVQKSIFIVCANINFSKADIQNYLKTICPEISTFFILNLDILYRIDRNTVVEYRINKDEIERLSLQYLPTSI